MRKYSGSGRIFFATTEAMNNDKRPFNGFLNISETINKSSWGKEQSLKSYSFTFGYNRGFCWLRVRSLFNKILLMESLIFGGNLENLSLEIFLILLTMPIDFQDLWSFRQSIYLNANYIWTIKSVFTGWESRVGLVCCECIEVLQT